MTQNELRELTRRTWEPIAGHPISDDEAEEIIQNTTSLLRLLLDWQRSPAITAAPGEDKDDRIRVPALDKNA